ncbi:MAG: arginine--tRNA ligase [Nitrososphaeria archaeon]
MTFRIFRESVRRSVDAALAAMGAGEIEYSIDVPPERSLGDLAVNAPFRAAKILRDSPGAVAQRIADAISRDRPGIIGSVSAHPSGYVNFFAEPGEMAYLTLDAALGPGGWTVDIGRGTKVSIEHTSVNPNKALHVGHARNLVLGDSLVRLLSEVGYRVEALNYVDDTGVQVADILVGMLYLGIPEEPVDGSKYDKYCGDYVYVRVNDLYGSRPDLLERRREVLAQLERGSGPAAEVASRVVPRILRAQLDTCWRIGARYDLLNFESHILRAGLWDRVFEELKAVGAVRHVDEGELAGCWVLQAPGEGEEKVLIRSDGTTVYAAKDIPYAAWKLGLLDDPFSYRRFADQPGGRTLWTTALDVDEPGHPEFGSSEIAITVIDVRQSRVQGFVSYAVELLGRGANKRYIHLGYDVVALSRRTAEALGIEIPEGSQFVHMSGRRGSYVNVDDVLEALALRAADEVRRRNQGAPEDWVRGVAEAVAVGALRYQMLRQDPNKIIIFDMDDALRIEGETGPYLQYTYARASRILEKGGSPATPITRDLAALLRASEEVDLVKAMSRYDIELEAAASAMSPRSIAIYSYEMANAFNRFYEKHRVLQEPDEGLRSARLALVGSFRVLMGKLLSIMGIEPLDRI